MIIIGYQGIGKSTYCFNKKDAIDLESSHFRYFNGERPEHWEELYIKTALSLNGQGYDVFISSHKEVREALTALECVGRYRGFQYCAIVPSIALKDDWIKRLEDRYNKLPSNKNKAALENAIDRYEDNIKEIAEDIENTFYIVDHPNNYDIFKFMDKVKSYMNDK